MANIVKQVAIFNKDQNSGMGSWETKDIGALASNISLVTPIGGNSNLEDVLHQVLPNNGLSSGFIEATNGQLQSSNKSDAINNFFDSATPAQGELNTIKGNISTLQSGLNNKVNIADLDNAIATWVADHMSGDDATITPGLTEEEISNKIYPIGSVYISFSNTNPATLFGGTWEQLQNRFLYASTSSSNQTGGAASVSYTPAVTLTRSTNVAISNHSYTPAGTNKTNFNVGETSGYGAAKPGAGYTSRLIVAGSTNLGVKVTFSGTATTLKHTITQPVFTAKGTAATIDTMPPYITVYMWKRLTLAPVSSN